MATGKIFNWKDVSLYPNAFFKEASDAFSQAVYNCLRVSKGDIIGFPEFGCNPEDLLFEPMDEVTEFLLLDFLIGCIEGWEPRVKVSSQSTVVGDKDRNMYDVELVLSEFLVSSETPNQMLSYKFSLPYLGP